MVKIINVLVVVSFFYADNSFAIAGFGVGYSKRWHKDEDDNEVNANTVTLSGEIDPIDMVPIAAGLSYTMAFYDADGLDFLKALGIVDSLKGNELAIGLRIWVPVIPKFEPYIRADYVVWGTYDIKFGNGEEINNKVSGAVIGTGLQFSPIPLVRAMVEYRRGFRQMESDPDQDVFPNQMIDEEKKDFHSHEIGLGVQLRI